MDRLNFLVQEIWSVGPSYYEGVVAAEEEGRLSALYTLTQEERELVARLVTAEAGAEPYLGQLAVAAVVANRVESQDFPDSVEEVIYQKKQFTPAMTGKIHEVVPTKEAYRAVDEAFVLGLDPTGGVAIGFYNPQLTDDEWVRSRPEVITLWNHVFFR